MNKFSHSLVKFEIPKRSVYCSGQGERLQPGTEIYSLLLEDETQGRLIRRDFCLTCWTQKQAEEHFVIRGYWKSLLENKKSPVKSARIEKALQFFDELLHAPVRKEAEIFVLSLFLAHARQLALRQELTQEGRYYHLYEMLKTGDLFTIPVVDLSPSQIENIQQAMASRL